MHLRPDLIYNPIFFISSKILKNLHFSTRNKKYDNQVLANVFQDPFHIQSDVFKELDLYSLILYIIIQNNRKIISKRHNIARSI